MTTKHLPNITVNVVLAPLPGAEAGFSTVLLMVPQATNSLNGERVEEYISFADMETAQTAGYISAATLEAGRAAFAQRDGRGRRITSFKLGRVDLAGGETYATGLTAIIAADDDFYGLAISPRTDTEMALVSVTVEALTTKNLLFAMQGDDASWLDAGVPAGLSTTEDNERTIGCYHDTDSEWMDVAYLCNRLIYDPDVQSAGWVYAPLRGIDAYATEPTAAQRVLALANEANLGLPLGGSDFVIDKGTNMASRPIEEIVTADWFSTRLRERTAALAVAHAARGERVIMDTSGQLKILTVIEALLQQGVGAGHFIAGQTEAVAEAITSDDLTARELRFTVRAQDATTGRLFTFDCNFSREPIADDA